MNADGFFHLLAARDDRILDRLWQQELVVATQSPASDERVSRNLRKSVAFGIGDSILIRDS
jgi:hypothetical protein